MSDTLPQKLYFRIGEVAGIVGVEPHVLRYWEREFRSIRPTKSARGQRVYSRRDVENLLRVRELLYTQGFTIAGARKQLQRPASSKDAAPDEARAPSVAGNGGKPPVHAAPPPRSHDPPGPKNTPKNTPETTPENTPDDTLRGTLVSLRDEVAAFLDELGG